MWAGQSFRPSIRTRYTGSPTSRSSPPSRRRCFVHINAIKVLPARGVDCAARGPAHAARSPARRARSVPLRARLAHCGPLAARRAPRKSPSPHLNPSRRAGRSFGPSALQSAPSNALSNICIPSSQRLICVPTTCKQGQPAYPRLSPSRLSPTRQCKHAVVDPPPQPPPDPGALPSHPPPHGPSSSQACPLSACRAAEKNYPSIPQASGRRQRLLLLSLRLLQRLQSGAGSRARPKSGL